MTLTRRMKRGFGGFVGIAIFVLALTVLHRELQQYHAHDISAELRALRVGSILAALFLTALNYVIMTGYDVLAFRYIQRPLAYRRIAFVSFISYSFSNNMGAFMLSGVPVRYRLYSAWGLSATEIAQVAVFCTVSLWLGFLSLTGLVFLIHPALVPAGLVLHVPSLRLAGFIFLLPAGAYVLHNALRKNPFSIRGWSLPLVPVKLSLFQLFVSSLDWAVAAAVFYVLLPHGGTVTFPAFLSVFLLAQFAGLVSTVPGGLGVFESVILLSLGPVMPSPAIMAALLAYRAIYYLAPLTVSVATLTVYEGLRSIKLIGRAASTFGKWISVVAPRALAVSAFIGGTVLMVSGAVPAKPDRLAWLAPFLPLPVIELSHFLGSLAGIGLLLLSRAIQRRIDAAYFLGLLLLGGGAVVSLLKGFDYEEAAILTFMFAGLLPSRRYFYRRASLFDVQLTQRWIMAIVFVVAGSLWIGLFSYKHLEYSHELWWRFVVSEDAPRFLRASAGIALFIIMITSARLLRPAGPGSSQPASAELAQAWPIAAASPRTSAYLALLGDKRLLFSESGKAFLMYAVSGRSWIVMGDPVGPLEEQRELIWQFQERCDRYDGWPVFYEVREENLSLYVDAGLSFVKLGEEGRVPLAAFRLDGSDRKEFRHVLRTIEKQGCSFDVVPTEAVPAVLPVLNEISDAWLADKKTGEKGFSLGFFKPDYIERFPAAVVRRGSDILAFATIWPGGGREELSIDLMRHRPEAPHGTMDFLFVHLMLWGKEAGYQWFNLGMAPFSGFDEGPEGPLWNRLASLLYRHGEYFYNFQGLRRYKEKFGPEWSPRYLAVPSGLALPRILTNIAALVSGGLKGVIAK